MFMSFYFSSIFFLLYRTEILICRGLGVKN